MFLVGFMVPTTEMTRLKSDLPSAVKACQSALICFKVWVISLVLTIW